MKTLLPKRIFKSLVAATLILCHSGVAGSEKSDECQTPDRQNQLSICRMEADNILNEQTDYTPACSWGSAKRYIAHCRQLDASYIVDVLLPEDYDPNAAKRYPVVYMHDGQNLFDPALSYGGVSWAVDKALKRLSQSEEFQVPIIVGIHNREELRSSDYLC
ncbi:MAG: hypothetical protein K2I25_08240, partial [Muribaculaceae bacterium]|nr:hypothetical protein [Muribaculaceae bacterium]